MARHCSLLAPAKKEGEDKEFVFLIRLNGVLKSMSKGEGGGEDLGDHSEPVVRESAKGRV